MTGGENCPGKKVTKEAGALLGNIMKNAMGGNQMMSSMGQVSEEMMGFMRNMRLSDALKMAGDKVTMEMKLKRN